MKSWKSNCTWSNPKPPRCVWELALEFAQCFRQGDSLSGLAVMFRILNRALTGCVHSDFRYSEQITPDQAAVQPTPENDLVLTLSGTHNHADADTGINGRRRMRGGFLRQFVAILCRLADALTSRLGALIGAALGKKME